MSVSKPLRVIVPMKPVYEGKSRLAGVLEDEARAALCLHLLQHVLSVIKGAKTPLETLVVGGDEWVQEVAFQESAFWEADPGKGLNEAIVHAASRAFSEDAPAILVLPGDLGFLRAEDVDNLVTLSRGLERVVLARAAADGGTNALLAPSGMMIRPSFGSDSFKSHLEAARKAGVPVEVSSASGLSFDLDSPADLLLYRSKLPDFEQTLASWRRRLQSANPGGGEKEVRVTAHDA